MVYISFPPCRHSVLPNGGASLSSQKYVTLSPPSVAGFISPLFRQNMLPQQSQLSNSKLSFFFVFFPVMLSLPFITIIFTPPYKNINPPPHLASYVTFLVL